MSLILAENIVRRARLLAALSPTALAATGLNLTEADVHCEDLCTALARQGLVPNEGLVHDDDPDYRPLSAPDPEHLYEKCQHCHLFVSPEDVECSSTGDGCTCGWRPSRLLQLVQGQYTPAESAQYSAEYMAHTPQTPQTYVHLHRGDDVDNALDESHKPTPSGRKANLLTWKTYGPVAMRERFTS